MNFRIWTIVASVSIGLGATAPVRGSDLGPGAAPDGARNPPGPAALRLSTRAATIYGYVKARKPGEFGWQRIPWLGDLPEAIRQARAEGRPILIWATDDDPLDRC